MEGGADCRAIAFGIRLHMPGAVQVVAPGIGMFVVVLVLMGVLVCLVVLCWVWEVAGGSRAVWMRSWCVAGPPRTR